MSENNRVHAINAIAERLPLAPTDTLPPDASLATYGDDVFGAKMIRKYLSKGTAAKLLAVVNDYVPLDPSIADEVADGMKRWAVEKGATHFTHWFQILVEE